MQKVAEEIDARRKREGEREGEREREREREREKEREREETVREVEEKKRVEQMKLDEEKIQEKKREEEEEDRQRMEEGKIGALAKEAVGQEREWERQWKSLQEGDRDRERIGERVTGAAACGGGVSDDGGPKTNTSMRTHTDTNIRTEEVATAGVGMMIGRTTANVVLVNRSFLYTITCTCTQIYFTNV